MLTAKKLPQLLDYALLIWTELAGIEVSQCPLTCSILFLLRFGNHILSLQG